jgi:hypothetical protein
MVFFEDLVHRKIRKDLLPEQFGPLGIHQFFALGPKKRKWVENVKGFVVFKMNHGIPSYLLY